MRHRVKTKTLGRDTAHRKALMKNLSTSLILCEKITTTVAKAKYLRPYIEKLITRARLGNDFNNVKYFKARLTDDKAVRKILEEIAPRFLTRPGGYTKITKLANRAGDNAPMARIEFTEKAKRKEEKKIKEPKKIKNKEAKK